jgi:pyruvate kinase
VNDAANAVDDAVDAIMLTGETAVGKFPARAVQTLDAIIRDAEAVPPDERTYLVRRSSDEDHDHVHALCAAAVTLAARGDAQAIVAVTRGGSTARRLSMLRPRAPVLAATSRVDTARRLALHWGVVPVLIDGDDQSLAAASPIGQQLVARGLVAAGAVVVLINIDPDLTKIDANYLRIQRL